MATTLAIILLFVSGLMLLFFIFYTVSDEEGSDLLTLLLFSYGLWIVINKLLELK